MTWAQRNPDKIRGYNQKYRAKNLEYFREYMRDYMNNHLWYRQSSRLKSLMDHPDRSLFSVFCQLKDHDAVTYRTPFDELCDKEEDEITLQNCNIG